MTVYGYVRVSSKSQEQNSSIQTQKQQLLEKNVLETNIVVEVGSATTEIRNRPIFQKLIDQTLQKGDSLIVTKIDRCSRNTLEFLKLQDILHKRGIQFQSLDLPYSNDPDMNKFVATTLANIAEFETNRRKERQREGIRAAQKEGKYKGRKTVITPKLIQQVKLYKEKKLAVREIARLIGVSTPTIYKILKEHLGYVPNRLVQTQNIDNK